MLLDKNLKKIQEMVEKAESNPKYELVENRIMDYMVLFALAKKFSTPFSKTQAFKLGIIDDKGNVIRSPITSDEKNAFTPLDNIVTKIKKLIPSNLWYLLTFAYIFKGFANVKTYKSIYEGNETEQELIKEEEKRLALIRAKKEVEEIIKTNTKFTEEDYWNFITEQID